jgi:hypothetical protein
MPYFAVPRYLQFVNALPVKLRERGVTAETWDREAARLQSHFRKARGIEKCAAARRRAPGTDRARCQRLWRSRAVLRAGSRRGRLARHDHRRQPARRRSCVARTARRHRRATSATTTSTTSAATTTTSAGHAVGDSRDSRDHRSCEQRSGELLQHHVSLQVFRWRTSRAAQTHGAASTIVAERRFAPQNQNRQITNPGFSG